MSLELCLIPSDYNGKARNILLDPGQEVYIMDYMADEEIVVAIGCREDDSSRVRLFPYEGPFVDGFTEDFSQDELPQPIGTIVVDEDHPFEDLIKTGEETTRIISARKVDSAKITASFLIPILLRHPN